MTVRDVRNLKVIAGKSSGLASNEMKVSKESTMLTV